MTYLQTHRRAPRNRQHIGFTLAIIVALIIVIQVLAPHFFSGIFIAIARPFWRTEFTIQSGGLKTAEQQLADNKDLLRQIDELNLRLLTISSIETENAELRSLLGRTTDAIAASSTGAKSAIRTRPPGILAAVLRRPPLSGYDQLIIDIGRDYSVSTTSLVYASGNVLVGKVVDVLATTAKVRLFTSAGESFPVLIGPSHIAATALGRGGGQYEAQVSREAAVTEGDAVLDSSFDDKPLGLVSTVLIDPTQPFKTVIFAPPLNVYQVRWVTVK